VDSSSHNNGNVMGITNNRDTTRSQGFTYDSLNRIATAKTSSTSGSNCWGETYTIDQWANLTAIGAVTGYTGCTQESLSVAATTNNQLAATGFSYDLAGNMFGDAVNIYGWNAESEIKSAAGVNYTYDGDGNRVQKSNGKIYWYGAGTEILDESDSSGNITDEYVFFGGKRVAHRVVSSGSISYYAEDFLGSSRAITTSTGTLCYDADFYPYGGERLITSTCAQNYEFEGKERDTETGNDDFGARYYTSRLGRWLSADWSAIPAPVPYANLTNPQTLNLYAMVRNNPETFADLDGHLYCVGGTESCPGGSAGDSGPAGDFSPLSDSNANANAEGQTIKQQSTLSPASRAAIKQSAKTHHYPELLLGYLVLHAAAMNHINPNLLVGLGMAEGSLNPSANIATDKNNVNHYGMFQMSPSELAAIGLSPEDVQGSGRAGGPLWRNNLEAGAEVLSGRIQKFHGDVSLALASYTLGPNSRLLRKGYAAVAGASLNAGSKTVGSYVSGILSYAQGPY